jgi:hypothetical protein
MSFSLQFLNVKSFIDTIVKEKLNELTTTFETKYRNVNCSTFSNDFNNFIKNSQERIFNDIKDKGDELFKILNENESKEAGEYMKTITTEHMKYMNSLYEKKMYECELETFNKNSTYLGESGRVYEFVMQGDVKITKVKKIYDSTHKITFHSVNKILTYQVHKNKNEKITFTYMPIHPDNEGDHPIGSKGALEYIKNNPEKVASVDYNLNKQRNVKLTNIDEFIRDFNIVDNFKPTTIMEIGFKRYPFVINKVKKDKNNKMSFYISTKEIRLMGKCSNTLVKKIPIGMYKRVRFDIDDLQLYGNSHFNSELNYEYFCPPGSVITTLYYEPTVSGGYTEISEMKIGVPDQCRFNCRSDYPYLTGGVCYSGCNKRPDDYAVGPCCWTPYYLYGLFGESYNFPYSDYCKSSYIPKSFSYIEKGYKCKNDDNNPDYRVCMTETRLNVKSCYTAKGDDNRGSCCPDNCNLPIY